MFWLKYFSFGQVKWAKDDIDGYLNFFSISGDGRVSNWTIVKTAMWSTDVLTIGYEKSLKNFDNPGTIFKGMPYLDCVMYFLSIYQ